MSDGKLAGLPFAPFDIFDWIVRLLPGASSRSPSRRAWRSAATFGVTNISVGGEGSAIRRSRLRGLLVAGVVSGAVLFALLSLSDEPALLFGGILGAVLGGLALIAEQRLQRLPPGSIVPGAWVFVTFLAWGVAFGWVTTVRQALHR